MSEYERLLAAAQLEYEIRLTKIKNQREKSHNEHAAVMRGAFRFAVFPKQLITFNPMQYVVVRGNSDDYEMFSEEKTECSTDTSFITPEQFLQMTEYLKSKNIPSLLAFQIGYYTGLYHSLYQ